MPLPERDELLAQRAADLAIEKHLQLCEARKIVLAHGTKEGMDVRVTMLESDSTKRNKIHNIVTAVIVSTIASGAVSVVVWLMVMWKAH